MQAPVLGEPVSVKSAFRRICHSASSPVEIRPKGVYVPRRRTRLIETKLYAEPKARKTCAG